MWIIFDCTTRKSVFHQHTRVLLHTPSTVLYVENSLIVTFDCRTAGEFILPSSHAAVKIQTIAD